MNIANILVDSVNVINALVGLVEKSVQPTNALIGQSKAFLQHLAEQHQALQNQEKPTPEAESNVEVESK